MGVGLLGHAWICELCYRVSDAQYLPSTWEIVHQSIICPTCGKRVRQDLEVENRIRLRASLMKVEVDGQEMPVYEAMKLRSVPPSLYKGEILGLWEFARGGMYAYGPDPRRLEDWEIPHWSQYWLTPRRNSGPPVEAEKLGKVGDTINVFCPSNHQRRLTKFGYFLQGSMREHWLFSRGSSEEKEALFTMSGFTVK